MTILLTGSNGFIGQYIYSTKALEEHEVIYGTTSNITSAKHRRFSKYYSDIDLVLKKEKIDIIIHLASEIPTSYAVSDLDLYLKNTTMIGNLTDFSIKNGVSKFIYISGFGSMIFPEKYDIKDYYTLSKVVGEHFCTLLEANGIETASLRVSSPFGEFYHANNVLKYFVELAIKNKTLQVHGSGKREQNFIYVGNIIHGILKCIEYNVSGVYSLVAKEDTSMSNLAKMIIALTGSKSNIEYGRMKDPLENKPSIKFSLNRITEELNYKAMYSLEDGLKKYIKWKKEKL